MLEEAKQAVILQQKEKKNEKRTRKTKADIVKPDSKKHHATRRRRDYDSSDQNPMPAEIPKSSDVEPIVTEGSENELNKIAIRIPLAMLQQSKIRSQILAKIQSDTAIFQIQKQQQDLRLIASLKIPQQSGHLKALAKNEQELELEFSTWGRYVYISGFQVHSKVIKKTDKQIFTSEQTEILKIKIKQAKSDLFIFLNMRAEEYSSDDFNGLVNQGNTCYMNSYLQTLYHIPAFRNLVFEAEVKDQSKFPATLQSLFFNLHHAEKAVSPESLVKSFGWGKKQASIQQDAQQFSCLFFEILEKKLGESAPSNGYKSMTIRDLFKGELMHYIDCTKVSTFLDLQLPVFPTLSESLDSYTLSEHLAGDNKFMTEEYGLQEANKGIKISNFPPVLMIQLKRFLYDFVQLKNVKILDRLEYDEIIDFAKWSMQPDHSKHQYELYAVMVHQGSKADSGHYYNFVKSEDKWYKCNDEFVELVEKQKAFNYNFGGFHETIDFDARQMKVNKKFVESKSTAYMLVYVRMDLKDILMKDNMQYPQWLHREIANKAEFEEEKKVRKLYYHNIKVFDWNINFKGTNCADFGFLDEDTVDKKAEIITKIPKNMTIAEWLYGKEKMQVEVRGEQKEQQALKPVKVTNKNGKKNKIVKNTAVTNDMDQESALNPKNTKKSSSQCEQSDEQGLYVFHVNQQREILNSYQDHNTHTIEHLMKGITDPYLIKAPIQVSKSQYLVICKRFTSVKIKAKANNTSVKQTFIYDRCLKINRQINYKTLRELLTEKFCDNESKSRSKSKSKSKFKQNQQQSARQSSPESSSSDQGQDRIKKIIKTNDNNINIVGGISNKKVMPASPQPQRKFKTRSSTAKKPKNGQLSQQDQKNQSDQQQSQPQPQSQSLNQNFVYNFFFDDWKLGCIQIQSKNVFLPPPTPHKNQLLVCVIEQMDVRFSNSERQEYGFRHWFQNKKTTVCLTLIQESSEQQDPNKKHQQQSQFLPYQLKQINDSVSVNELRKVIFEEVLGSNKIYKAPQNIVIKYRAKKNSKLYSEATSSNSDNQLCVRDLIKHDDRIIFSYSELSVESRLNNYQLIFYYRFGPEAGFELSDPIRIVLMKSQPKAQVIQKIKTHPEIIKHMKKQKVAIDTQVMVMLLSKEKHIINDVVDDDGKVIGKSDFQTVLKRQKYDLVIVQPVKKLIATGVNGNANVNGEQGIKKAKGSKGQRLLQIPPASSSQPATTRRQQRNGSARKASIASASAQQAVAPHSPAISQQASSPQNQVIILLQHVSQNLQRVGHPRMFKVDKRIELSELRVKVLDMIINETYEYEDKKFVCNPFKLMLRIFGKDHKRIVMLEEEDEENEMEGAEKKEGDLKENDKNVNSINKLNIQEQQSELKVRISIPPPLSSDERSGNTQEDDESERKGTDNEMGEGDCSGYEQDDDLSKSNNQDNNLEENCKKEIKQNGAPLKNAQNNKIQEKPEGPPTILTHFAKHKVLKLQVMHFQMTKPNVALKFNLDS